MFDGFSSLLKPENTSEFSPRFSVSFSRGRRNEFSLSSLQVASGENFWGFCEAIEKSRGNRKKLVIAMLWGDGGLRSAAVEIRGPSTQNPLVAIPCGFESHHRHQIETPSVRVVFLFCYAKRSKIRNAPFPRPCGATGNGARKLHAHFVCGMRCPYAADLMGKQEENAAVRVVPEILYRYFSPICV